MAAGWDQTKFNEILREYAKWSKRTITQILNTKAYFIARKAIWYTSKADANRIKAKLGQIVYVNALNKKGKVVRKRKLTLVRSSKENAAPLAALIVNIRRGQAGKKGLYGKKMTNAIARMLSARLRSVAFIKSGWLQAVRKLEKLADRRGKPPTDSAAKQIGRPKGDAFPARELWASVCKIVNRATTRRDQKHTLEKVGTKGLDRAFNDEMASMNKYVEEKMAKDAARFNKGAA